MDNILQKIARQLNQYDEASLMSLWEKYAAQVAEFEPTARWEEAALILSMIQAVHWKNQLFNTEFANCQQPVQQGPDNELKNELAAFFSAGQKRREARPGPAEGAAKTSGNVGKGKKSCKVLAFRTRDLREPE